MDKKKVDNTKSNKKRVNNTNFKTNLTVQVVCRKDFEPSKIHTGGKPSWLLHFLPELILVTAFKIKIKVMFEN
jgi:hypothetical protein